jgi:hypothetical protein
VEIIRILERDGVPVGRLEERSYEAWQRLHLNDWMEIVRLLVKAGAWVESMRKRAKYLLGYDDPKVELLREAQREFIEAICEASFRV